MQSTRTLSDLASEAARYFERRERDDGESSYVTLRDDRPEWVHDLVYAAHGGLFLPDDWRYEAIRAALDHCGDDGLDPDDGHEFADRHVDVYADELLKWLGSNLNRASYCDEAAAELGHARSDGIVALIGLGQYAEGLEVFGLVVDSLRERLDSEPSA